MKYLLGLLVTFNIADAVITHFLIKLDLAHEGNSILAPIVGQPIFIILKVVGVLLMAFILWDVYRRHHRAALVVTTFFVAFYGLVVLWNLSLFKVPSLFL